MEDCQPDGGANFQAVPRREGQSRAILPHKRRRRRRTLLLEI